MSEFQMDGIDDHILTADLWQSLRFRGGLIEIIVRMRHTECILPLQQYVIPFDNWYMYW